MKKAQLVAAGKSIRKMALMRNELVAWESGWRCSWCGRRGGQYNQLRKKKQEREMSTSDDDIAASLIEQSAKRRHIETRRIDLEQ